MLNTPQVIKKHANLLMKLLPIVAFAVPLLWLYALDAASFELMWKGRTFELFFIWLIGLELILGWGNPQANKLCKMISGRTAAFIVAMALPTFYVVAANYWGLNTAITIWAEKSNIQWANSMPLSTEYLVFGALFCAIIFLSFGFKGVKAFSVPAFFLILVGAIYTIDNAFPYGQFTPFQIFVPTTTTLAAAILNLMGYTTSISYGQNSLQGSMPLLTAKDLQTGATATFSIAWPCAGIESFLIFTVVILLFLKRMPISLKGKIGYFAFGAAITYTINALRIVNIYLTAIKGENIDILHFYYGPLPAIAWIVSYPLIIIGSQTLWHRIKKPKPAMEPQPTSPNPA